MAKDMDVDSSIELETMTKKSLAWYHRYFPTTQDHTVVKLILQINNQNKKTFHHSIQKNVIVFADERLPPLTNLLPLAL